MNPHISLRPATMNDAEMLFEWRNDPETRNASCNTSEIEWSEHLAWLSRTLGNPDRKLFVAEESGTAVGTVRADFSDGVWELSWTVSPDARGRGVAKQMVVMLANQLSEPIRAKVKTGNFASGRIAEHAGMKFEREADGVLHYKRPALGNP